MNNNLSPDVMTCGRCKIPISAPHGWVAEQYGSGYFHSLDAYCIQSQAAKIAALEYALMASRTRLEQPSVPPNASQWIACADRLPSLRQNCVLASTDRMRAHDPDGCAKDVGHLEDYGNGRPFWSTQGESRSMTLSSFTHWMPISDPGEPSVETSSSGDGIVFNDRLDDETTESRP